MKKLLIILLCLFMITGCSSKQQPSVDAKDRPSNRGQLQVIDGQLCGKDGKPVMLRGISGNGVALSHMYVSDDTFKSISEFMGCNVFRIALYTWGVGVAGYCTGGNKPSLMKDVCDSVEYCKNHDMYAMIDWHILEDNNPNIYIEDAKVFFDEVSKKFKDYNNVIYEICNEPNKCTWDDIKKYANVIIPIIRANDPDSVIIVGTPTWSQDVDIAADDPLEYDNLMYTLHFYSATHKQSLRNKALYALKKGLPLFVTEFGITASSGGYPIDEDEGNKWIDFLEENKISYVMWNFSRAMEPCAALNRSSLKTKDFELEDFSQSGQWLIKTIKERSNE